MRRIGVLMYTTPDEPESQARIAALLQGLQEAGWAIGRNVRIDTRWSGAMSRALRKDAVELVALGSDVLVAGAGPTTGTLQQATRTVPIVFAQGLDPVGNGFIGSLARPGGNTTGFNQFEYGLSGKWLGLLREIAPQVSRVGVVRDLAGGPAGVGQWAVIQAFASPMGVELSPIHARIMGGETERDVADFASAPNGGLIVAVGTDRDDSTRSDRRARRAAQAARSLSLPLLRRGWRPDVVRAQPDRSVPACGGLRRPHSQGREARRSAGPDSRPSSNWSSTSRPPRRSASTVPPTLLARADEVIE